MTGDVERRLATTEDRVERHAERIQALETSGAVNAETLRGIRDDVKDIKGSLTGAVKWFLVSVAGFLLMTVLTFLARGGFHVP